MNAVTTVPCVAFDGAVLAAGPITGVGRAFLTALAAYARAGAARSLVLLPADAAVDLPSDVEIVPVPRGPARLAALPRVLRRLGADLLHSPVAALPAVTPCPSIATVHDVPWLVRPRLRERGCGWRHRAALRWALWHAAAIVVPSEATARDVRRIGSRGAPALHVVRHGVVPPAAPADASASGGPFLVLGDDRPRKNLARVREAHARALASAPDLPRLLLVGPGFGYLAEADKLAALRHARALLHLALHEGFGLPLIEAFAHGVPVLASDIDPLRETAAGAALLADPRDVDAMAHAMVRVHRDQELRAQLRTRGLARAAALTPEAAADGWRRVHDAVLGAVR